MDEIQNTTAFPKATLAFRKFLRIHNPRNVRRHFRSEFFSYIHLTYSSGSGEDCLLYFKELSDLFHILDIAVDEERGKRTAPENKNTYPEALQAFRAFLCTHNPFDVSRHFRAEFFNYISLMYMGDGFPEGEFVEYFGDLFELFEILDIAIGEEWDTKEIG